MGCRSTFISEHYCIDFPIWFKEKWADLINFSDGKWDLPFSSKFEIKEYGHKFGLLLIDLEKALKDEKISISMVALDEYGGVTKYTFKNGERVLVEKFEETEGN